jgi:hypothetical protein
MSFYEFQHLHKKGDRSKQYTVYKIRGDIIVLCEWENEFDDHNYKYVEYTFEEAKELFQDGWW